MWDIYKCGKGTDTAVSISLSVVPMYNKKETNSLFALLDHLHHLDSDFFSPHQSDNGKCERIR